MVYLLHFTERYKHAGHYIGTAKDLTARIEQHRSGQGARLLQAVCNAGIDFVIARTWEGGRDLERRLKRWHNGAKLCPICAGNGRGGREACYEQSA